MINFWFISDTHFNHTNILSFKDNNGDKLRPFSSTEEMNETMIENWNKVVKPQDKVYHLGDVIFGDKKDFDGILSRLNGKKRLVLGNHDYGKEKLLAPYFKEMSSSRQFIKDDFKCILSHIPLHPDCIERFGNLNIHGHLHCNNVYGEYKMKYYNYETEKEELEIGKALCNNYLNVCVEQTNYKPINLEELIKK